MNAMHTSPLPSQKSAIRRAVDRRGFLDFCAATLACALIALAALGHAWLRTRVTEEGYRLSRLAAEARDLAREHETLQIRAAELKSPQRLEQLARAKLGMGPPAADKVVVLVGDAVRPASPPVALATPGLAAAAIVAAPTRSSALIADGR